MASRPILSPYLIINGASMAATITSPPTIVQNMSMISYDISWTGSSPSGVIYAQSSNTYSQNADGTVANAGDWNNLPLSTPATVSGNTGSGVIEIDATAMFAIRIQYVPVSGTGSLSATVTGKVQ